MIDRGTAALIAAAILLLPGCTVVKIGHGDAARVRYYPGIAIVQVKPGAGSEIISSRSLGISVNRSTLSLGWMSADMALVPPGECELLLWKPSAGATAAMGKLLPDTKLCTIEKGK